MIIKDIDIVVQIKEIAIRRFSTTLVETEAIENYCTSIYKIEELVFGTFRIIFIYM